MAPDPNVVWGRLANGMRLIVAQRSAVPVVRFSLQLDAGYAADQFAAPGLATMTMEISAAKAMSLEGGRTEDPRDVSPPCHAACPSPSPRSRCHEAGHPAIRGIAAAIECARQDR